MATNTSETARGNTSAKTSPSIVNNDEAEQRMRPLTRAIRPEDQSQATEETTNTPAFRNEPLTQVSKGKIGLREGSYSRHDHFA